MASYAQELDEIVDALLLLFAGQDRLEPLSIKRMRLPRKCGGFDVTRMYLRSPMAFLASAVNGNAGAHRGSEKCSRQAEILETLD